MTILTTDQLMENPAQVLRDLGNGPVVIRDNGEPRGAFVSAEDYELLRKTKINELMGLMTKIGNRAAANGMTEEVLQKLLNEDE